MSGTRQPTSVVLLKGKKHLTKEEIKNRQLNEVKAASDNVKPPDYLDKNEKKEFKKIAKELIKIEIISNLDVDSLSFFIQIKNEYLKVTKEVESRMPTKTIEVVDYDKDGNVINTREEIIFDEEYASFVKLQLRLLNSCRKCASDLGLSISSRCRLVIPKVKEVKPKNKFLSNM